MTSPSSAVLTSASHYTVRRTMTGTMKPFIAILLLLVNRIAGESVGSIATINTFDGHRHGPYIVKDFHSHAGLVAEALVGEESSGDGSYFDVDTESGDDNISENQPIIEYERLKSDVYPEPLDEIINVTTPQVVLESTTTTKPTTTKQMTTPRPTTTSSPSTTPIISEAPTTVRAPSTALPAITPTQSAVTAENSSCHSSCQELLYRASLTAKPNTTLIGETQTMAFTCEVNTEKENIQFLQNVTLHWEFEGENPPQSACALDDQKYLTQCEGFIIRELTERNTSFLRSHLIVSNLATQNTGFYKCQVKVNCCSSTMQHELCHNVTVWTANYTVPIALMSGITAGVFLILIAGVLLTRRVERNSNTYKSVPNTETETDGKIASHIPFTPGFDDCDSFSSSASF